MKHFIAINGSPRTEWNTARLLDEALAGAKAACPDGDAVTERIDLYKLSYTGCRSCFACKRIGGASYGRCAVRDGLTEVLEKVLGSDGVLIGSPIYYRNITGQLHSFYERLLFPYTAYSPDQSGIEQKHFPLGFLYTMNVTEQEYLQDHYQTYLDLWERFSSDSFGGSVGRVCAFNTYQFDNYGNYKADWFSEPEKAAYRDAHWENDRRQAFHLGERLAGK